MKTDSIYYTKNAYKILDNFMFKEIVSFLKHTRVKKDELLVAQLMTCYKRDHQRIIIRSDDKDKILYDNCLCVLNPRKACNKNVNIMKIEDNHILIFAENDVNIEEE